MSRCMEETPRSYRAPSTLSRPASCAIRSTSENRAATVTKRFPYRARCSVAAERASESRSTPITRPTPAPSNAEAWPPRPSVRSRTVCASDKKRTTSSTRTGSCRPLSKYPDGPQREGHVRSQHGRHQRHQPQALPNLAQHRPLPPPLSFRHQSAGGVGTAVRLAVSAPLRSVPDFQAVRNAHDRHLPPQMGGFPQGAREYQPALRVEIHSVRVAEEHPGVRSIRGIGDWKGLDLFLSPVPLPAREGEEASVLAERKVDAFLEGFPELRRQGDPTLCIDLVVVLADELRHLGPSPLHNAPPLCHRHSTWSRWRRELQ